MRIARPMTNGRLVEHFGHSRQFLLLDAGPGTRPVTGSLRVEAPEHQPGRLPRGLAEQGVTAMIAGGVGEKAKTILETFSIEVFTGAPAESPGALGQKYLEGRLVSREVKCHH